MASLKNFFVLLIVLLFAVLAGSAWMFLRWMDAPLLTSQKTIEFTIKAGSGVRSASRQIVNAGVPIHPLLFETLARVTGKANALKAGSYEVVSDETPRTLLSKIVNGKFSLANVTIIEGWTFRQMRNAIDAHPAIRHDTTGISDKELMKKIGARWSFAEGLFFPDTYLFSKGYSDIEVYQQAHRAMINRMDEAWAKRAENLPYQDAYQALIMASIIEKETGQASERDQIAAVFVNRLRVGMLLQTDPTVIYGMGDKYQGKIRKIDLQTDTPFNTYTRAGLPPTPIALVGAASLQAALHPAQSNAYYFVARGNGTSQFSASLEEHNRAVDKYQR